MVWGRIIYLISAIHVEAPRSLLLLGLVLVSIPLRPLFPDTNYFVSGSDKTSLETEDKTPCTQ